MAAQRLLTLVVGLWGVSAAEAQGTFVMPSFATESTGNPQQAPFFPGVGASFPVHYQEVFGSYDIGMPSGAHLITAVSFRLATVAGQNSLDAVLPAVELRMCTTPSRLGLLHSRFEDNLGSDVTTVFPRGALHVTATYVPGMIQTFDIHIPFVTPFVYDRAWGNLLLDVMNYGGNSQRVGFDYFDLKDDSVGSVYSDASTPEFGGAGTSGLVAQFEYRDVPEPAVTWLWGIGGSALIIGKRSMFRKYP